MCPGRYADNLRPRARKEIGTVNAAHGLPVTHPLRQGLPHNLNALQVSVGVFFFLALEERESAGIEHALPKIKSAKQPSHCHLTAFRY